MVFVIYLAALLLCSIPQAIGESAKCLEFRLSSQKPSCQTVRYLVPKTIRMAMAPGRSQALQQASPERDPSVLDCIQVQINCEFMPDSRGETLCHDWKQSMSMRFNGTINGTTLDLKVCLDETLWGRCMVGAPMLVPGRATTMMIVNFGKGSDAKARPEPQGCDCNLFEVFHTTQLESCFKANGNKRDRDAWFVVAGLIVVFGGGWLMYYGVTAAMGRAKRRRLQRERHFMTRSVKPGQTRRF